MDGQTPYLSVFLVLCPKTWAAALDSLPKSSLLLRFYLLSRSYGSTAWAASVETKMGELEAENATLR